MTTSIQEYTKTEAALVTLRKEYSGVIYEVETPAGMKSAREARAEIKGYPGQQLTPCPPSCDCRQINMKLLTLLKGLLPKGRQKATGQATGPNLWPASPFLTTITLRTTVNSGDYLFELVNALDRAGLNRCYVSFEPRDEITIRFPGVNTQPYIKAVREAIPSVQPSGQITLKRELAGVAHHA